MVLLEAVGGVLAVQDARKLDYCILVQYADHLTMSRRERRNREPLLWSYGAKALYRPTMQGSVAFRAPSFFSS